MAHMSEWWNQFAVKYESIESVFTTPDWYIKHLLINDSPSPTQIDDELWSLCDGYFALARDRVLKKDGSGYIEFGKPAILILYIANSIEAVQFHLHKIRVLSNLSPIGLSHPSKFPSINYGAWIKRFKSFESASYRVDDGQFVDKKVTIDKLMVCFLNNEDQNDEYPYLVEIRDKI